MRTLASNILLIPKSTRLPRRNFAVTTCKSPSTARKPHMLHKATIQRYLCFILNCSQKRCTSLKKTNVELKGWSHMLPSQAINFTCPLKYWGPEVSPLPTICGVAKNSHMTNQNKDLQKGLLERKRKKHIHISSSPFYPLRGVTPRCTAP